MQTFPLVGNVGVNDENSLSDKNAAGYIVREYCDEPSNFRENGTLGAFMEERGIIGLQGIDTRRLTHILRENNAMKGTITLQKP
jgi:carbamoyl-phosphate synthase small subunit